MYDLKEQLKDAEACEMAVGLVPDLMNDEFWRPGAVSGERVCSCAGAEEDRGAVRVENRPLF